jgi:hypothetical protein
MLIIALIAMFVSVQSNNGWGVAVGLFLMLVSPLCDDLD